MCEVLTAWGVQEGMDAIPSTVSFTKYKAPESRFCPAGVYEYPEVRMSTKHLQGRV